MNREQTIALVASMLWNRGIEYKAGGRKAAEEIVDSLIRRGIVLIEVPETPTPPEPRPETSTALWEPGDAEPEAVSYVEYFSSDRYEVQS